MILVALSVIGLFFIYSTGYIGSEFPVRPNWIRQSVFMTVGFTAAYFASAWDNRSWSWRLAILGGYAVTVILLIVVLFAGKEIGGARRWIVIGPMLLQPAEFAKIFTIMAGALILSGDLIKRRWTQFAAVLAIFAVPVILVMLEPSYGNAASMLPCLLVMLGATFLPAWLFRTLTAVIVSAILLAGAGVCYVRTLPPERSAEIAEIISPGFLHGYHKRRIASFLTADGGWNERQSVMAVSGGGVTGKGYLNGTMKNLGFLPRTVAPTDFIFAVIAEEGGFLFGVLPVLLLYGMMLWILLHWAAHSSTPLNRNLLMAGSVLLSIHIFIGIGMTVRMIPVIGLPLPLLSYGGSFTVSMLMLLGIMAGAARSGKYDDKSEKEKNSRIFSLGRFLRININRC